MISKLPFKIHTVQTDNGGEFGIQFHWHLVDKGIRHIYIRVKSPRLNGKVKRSHRIDEEEFYRMMEGVIINDIEILNEKLKEWEKFYNCHRPQMSPVIGRYTIPPYSE